MFGDEAEELRWVRITGLQSPTGQKLNGKVGQVLNEKSDADDRFQIKIDGDAAKGKMLKAANFVDVPRDELVKTCRLPAIGERAVPEVLLFPRDHSMFTKCSPRGNAPVPALVGVPLMVEKTQPYVKFRNSFDATNQSATALCIDPNNGHAPQGMEVNVGPCLVYRPGGLDLCYADTVAILDYMSKLIEQLYSEESTKGPDFDRHIWLTQNYFQRILRQGKKYKMSDLNILV